MTSSKKVDTKTPNIAEHKSGFDLYVAPPGRGTPQVNKGLRLELDFADAMERLVGYRDQNNRKVYPFKSLSDVMRSAIHIGFRYLCQQADDEELNEVAAQYDAAAKSQSAASRLLRTAEMVGRNKDILTQFIQQGAMEEAKSFFREQWKATESFHGYQQMKIQQGLEVFRPMLFPQQERSGAKAIFDGGRARVGTRFGSLKGKAKD